MPVVRIARRLFVVIMWLILANNAMMATPMMTMVARVAERTAETESNKEVKNATMEQQILMPSPTDVGQTAKNIIAEME